MQCLPACLPRTRTHAHTTMHARSQQEGVEARSVGNSQVLRETALVEALNLRAAIEMVLKNNAAAAAALADLPPR